MIGAEPADGSEQSSVGWLHLGPRRLAAQHSELVAQDEDLQILGGVATGEQGEELDGAAQRQVGESWQHLEAASAMGSEKRHSTYPCCPNPQASKRT